MQGAHRCAVVTAGTVVFVFVGGGSVFTATSSGPDPVRGAPPASDLQRAAEVALDEAGGGLVTEAEVRDDDSFYEIEIVRVDGARVDVQIDETFAVVSATADRSAPD